MKIAYIFSEFPSGQISNSTRVFSMVEEGHDVTVIANKPGNSKINQSEFEKYKNKITIKYINCSIGDSVKNLFKDFFNSPSNFVKNLSIIFDKNIFYQHYTKRVMGGLGKNGNLLSIKKRTKLFTFYSRFKAFENAKYDLVVVFFGTVGNNYLFVKKLYPEIKYFTYFVGFDYSEYVYRMSNPNIYLDLFNHADRIVAKSNFSKETLIDLGCSREKIAVDYNGINLNKFYSNTYLDKYQNINFIIVSRLEKKKAHLKILEAFNQILKSYSNFHFTIVGKGPEEAEILKFLKSNPKLDHHVTLAGFKSQSEVKHLLANHHVFLHPSAISSLNGSMEDTPTAILEAMACGLPIISSYHAGIPDLVIDGENGFLISEKNILGLSTSILKFIKNPEIIKLMGEKSRSLVEEKFDASKNAKFLIDELNKLNN